MDGGEREKNQLSERIEVAISEAIAARKASEKSSRQIQELKTTVVHLAEDLFEQRTGIPASWNRRLILVGLASAVAAFVSGCMQYVFHH